MKKLNDKISGPEESNDKDNKMEGSSNKSNEIKTFNKGNEIFIKYKDKEIPAKQLELLSKTDNNISNLIKNINQQKNKQNFNGTFNEFLLKQYS